MIKNIDSKLMCINNKDFILLRLQLFEFKDEKKQWTSNSRDRVKGTFHLRLFSVCESNTYLNI